MAIERVSDYTRKILAETKHKFRLGNLYRQCVERGGLRDGVEHEICTEAARAAGLSFDLNRPFVPWSALKTQQRDATVAGSGQYLTQVDNYDAIDTLRPWSVSVRAGISVVSGLKGNAAFPVTQTNVVGYWLNLETASVTPSDPVLGQLALTPRTVGALVTAGHQLWKAPQTEPYLRRELLRTLGTSVDSGILNGGGSAEPLGLLNQTGIGATSGGSLDWADVTTMQKTVAEANCDDSVVSFIGTPSVRQLLSARERASGSGFIWSDGRIAGQPGHVTSDMPSGTLICGAWSELLLGLFGPGVELAINPNDPVGFKTGATSVRVLLSCDVGIAHPAAFNAATSLT